MSLHLRYAARSHAGLLRTMNEDSVYAGPRLLAVADGMGGHAAGEVASAVAIAAVAPLDQDVPDADLLAMLHTSARTANAHLREMVAGDPTLEGMGTTLVALLFDRSRLGLLHIGDSRCYLLREGVLSQITHDHTLVQALVDEGRISEDDVSAHPHRSVITKVLDGRDDLEPDLSVREVLAGDRYLVCSDGLTGPVASLDTLREALLLPDVQESCDRLVQLALRGGGPDNVTVVVAEVVDDEEPDAVPVVAGSAAARPQEVPSSLTDSAAARAQVAEGREPAPRPDDPARTEPRRGRRTAIGVTLLLLLAAVITVITVAYVRTQFYVGLDGDHVAVFRGVRGSVAGINLARVEERTTLGVNRLSPIEQERLQDGIVANDERDARAIVERLIAAACPSPTPAITLPPTTSPAPTKSPVPVPTPSPTPCP
jgi:serine/threonine protein phosphatase PrpC